MKLVQECEETTKKNVYESQYMVALCNYFLQQGYLPEDITILTPYNGQIYQLAQVTINIFKCKQSLFNEMVCFISRTAKNIQI